jgi:tetratricopeptide (TPR) repeat protein
LYQSEVCMKKVIWAFVFLAMACGDSKEAKRQRFLLQGNNMVTKGSYQEARRYYNEALKIDSCFADALNNIGTTYYKEGNFTDALGNYNRALDCNPGFHDAYLNRANTYYELNNPAAALRDLEVYARNKPDTSLLFFSRALNYTRMHQYDDAVLSFRKAFQKDPENTEILINLGTVYYYKMEFDSASVVLNRALKLKEDPNIYNLFSLIETEKGNHDLAMVWIKKALAVKPDDAYFLNNRGYLHLLNNDLPKALADIDQSIGEDPYNPWAYRNKGIYYLKQNDPVAAIRLLERAEKMDANIDKINLYLGEAYFKNGDRKKACVYYEKALLKKEISEVTFKKWCSH